MKNQARSRKISIIIFAALFIATIGLKLWQWHWPSADIVLSDGRLNVFVADTPEHWHRGLGRRDDLGRHDGMLFLFPDSGRQGIVMRDMRFPIDIVWLQQGIVVDIAPNVALEPGVPEADLKVYYPRTDANAVLELFAGWTEAHRVKIGDRLEVPTSPQTGR